MRRCRVTPPEGGDGEQGGGHVDDGLAHDLDGHGGDQADDAEQQRPDAAALGDRDQLTAEEDREQ